MAFQDMLNDLQTILNRDDCSTAQATLFLQQGISRIQRECRLPSMERAMLINVGSSAMNFFVVPTDLIQPIDVLVQNEAGEFYPLAKASYRQLLRVSPFGLPKVYARQQTQIWIKAPALAGSQVQFIYFGNFSPFASVTAENELSASTPDLGIYAALSYAGPHYEHPLSATWETAYQTIKGEVQGMAYDLDANGGPAAVQPMYGDYD